MTGRAFLTSGLGLKATGGKSRGNNNHEVEVDKLSKQAKDRINDLGLDVDTLFSLRLEGKVRIYGIRDNSILKLLWFDPWHDIKEKGVYPSTRS